MKKILKFTGLTLLVLLLLAFTIPVVFKKQVQSLVKKEINKQLNANIDFKDVRLSLFRHFPKVTISIKGFHLTGKSSFSKDTLVSAENIDLTAGLFSVLKGRDIKVHGLYLTSPRIHLLVDKLGKNNWDIARSSSDTSGLADTSASRFKISLKDYGITDGFLIYDDKMANTYTELNGLSHSGSGDLTADLFNLSTSTRATSATLIVDDIPYLFNTNTELNADIKIDNTTNTYTFKTDDIQVNALKLSAEGFVQMINAQTYNMDLKFSSPTNNFKNILSMVPAIYKKDFEKVKTSGEASFSGFVKGIYSPSRTPAYDILLLVKNGSFQYPDLPKPVSNIQLNLQIANPDGQPDNAVIDISKGHLEFDKEPFDFHFNYKNPRTVQYIDAGARGKLDLSQLSKFIKLDPGTKLGGLVWADAFVRGPLKALQQQSGPFNAGGFFDIRNLYYMASDFPQPVQNGNMKATLTNAGGIADKTVIDITNGHLELGNDPIDFTLQLQNPVSDVNFSGHAKGRLTLDHLKQFLSFPGGTTLSGSLNTDMGFSGSKSAIKNAEYDKIKLNGRADLANVNYLSKDYPSGISIKTSSLAFSEKNITLSNFTAKYLSSNITAAGTLNNLVGYLAEEQPLSGNLNATADIMNLNDWAGTTRPDTAASASSGKPFLVPPGINFTINAAVNKARYDKVDYNNINGTILISDEKMTFQNVKASALEGSILINGSYSTIINKEKPDISLSYDIRDMDVRKAFDAYNTIQFLMPIGKFLSGKLQSQLSMTGNLDGSMMPILNSLSGKGNLLLLQGVLAKFAPLEKIAAILDIDRLKSISLKDIKNYIEFSNGKVMVKPFTVKVSDIEMEIAGFHGFDQSMDYAIKMKLPRSAMGTKGNNLINDLTTKAIAKGIPFKPSETVDLSLKVTGTVSNPSVSVNLEKMVGDAIKEVQKQAVDFVKAKLDSATQKTRDSLQAVKKQVEDKAKEKLADKGIDTTNLRIETVKDTIKKSATDTLKKKIKKYIIGN